jgi:hypothetical protein
LTSCVIILETVLVRHGLFFPVGCDEL